ncbi:cytochrome P450 [Cyathus striatus]|nr:cytochrome P450 [Cyathus striatus]
MYFRIPGRELVVLNSLDAAKDLLEKRNLNYSDRPGFPVFEMMGWVPSLTFLRSGKKVNKHRKLMHAYLNKEQCRSYQNMQKEEVRLFVQRLIQNQNNMMIIFSYSLWHPVRSHNDKLFKIASEVGAAQGNSGPIGSTIVDLVPILRHFPSWFPGAYYAGLARRHKATVRKMFDFPFELVRENMKNGTALPSFLTFHLSNISSGDSETNTAEHAAGTDSTRSTITMFVIAMILYPEVQQRAQLELDRVVGRDRLPEFEDRGELPYLECILQECYRWNSVVPIGIPHRAIEDDVYKGMHIPKGALVIANTRLVSVLTTAFPLTGIHLDERIYRNPNEFDPSRYLPKPEGNAEPYPVAQFGFGRRVCPGLHLADGTIWIAIAYVLHSCKISRAVSEDGEEIIPEVKLSSGITSHPEICKCSIRVR